jgi:hypothetical protein
VPLEVGRASHRVSGLLEGGDAAALVVRAHDKHGNVLARAAVELAPPPAAGAPSTDANTDADHAVVVPPGAAPHEPGALTAVGAAAIGLGLVGAVASGISVASLGEAARDQGQLLLAGVAASTGVFVVGAALVVVDQL